MNRSRFDFRRNSPKYKSPNYKESDMRVWTLGLIAAAALCSGCGPVNSDRAVPVAGTEPVAPDNTAVNKRDADSAAKTPIDQNENQADIDVTANIRKRVVDTEMSVNAQNVKIMTQDGKVTLRGPVATQEEKAQIEKLAHDVAGVPNVVSELEVQP